MYAFLKKSDYAPIAKMGMLKIHYFSVDLMLIGLFEPHVQSDSLETPVFGNSLLNGSFMSN